nr:MAG TPA: hypothetical protein [Caudoviricetes sp.]
MYILGECRLLSKALGKEITPSEIGFGRGYFTLLTQTEKPHEENTPWQQASDQHHHQHQPWRPPERPHAPPCKRP